MKKAGIVVNTDKDINMEHADRIVSWLKARGVDPVVESAGELFNNASIECMCLNSDFLIVLGGDGTILYAARNAAFFDKPIIGFNLGNLGYLTDVDKSESLHALEKVFTGQYKIEKRMMLQGEIEGRSSTKPLIALNDICIVKGSLKMMNMEIMINDQYMDSYKADGVIISTPTGSTAYNLSAGGPILKPDTELIAITPICPHKIYSRPSVVSGEDMVYINICESQGDDIILSVDGQEQRTLRPGDKVCIFRSKYYTSLIKTNSLGFYDILREKLL